MAKDNFHFLLLGLLIVLVAEPFLGGTLRSGALIQLLFTSILVVGVFSLAANRRVFHAGLGLAAISVAAALVHLTTGSEPARVVNFAAIICFCLLAIGVTMQHVVLKPGHVTLNRLVGALCLYLLLGVMWAILFALLALVEPAAFHVAGSQTAGAVEHFLYYSFVTLTTLGYGDVTPVHPVARTLAYLESVIGQLYLAVLIAGLVGQHIAGTRSGTDA